MTAPTDQLDAEQLDQQPPTPAPLPQPRRGLSGGLGALFRAPDPEAAEHLSGEPPATQQAAPTAASPRAAEPSPSADEQPWSLDPDGESDPSSSAGSSTDQPKSGLHKLGKASAKAVATKGVLIAGVMAHRALARTEGQQLAGLYLTDDEDAENIGEPLGEIMARRGGVAGKALSPDAADALSAGMGLANYIAKQVALLVVAQQHDRGQLPPPPPVDL